MEKVTDKLVFKIECKQTQNKLCIASQCVDFWEEGINQSQTSISVCILLAAHVCQLMKSVHGSPVIDFREVLICRLRSGSSLCPSSFASSSPLHHPPYPDLSFVNTHMRTNLDTSCYVLRISALGSLSSAGCSSGEILQGKLFRAVSEVVRYD